MCEFTEKSSIRATKLLAKTCRATKFLCCRKWKDRLLRLTLFFHMISAIARIIDRSESMERTIAVITETHLGRSWRLYADQAPVERCISSAMKSYFFFSSRTVTGLGFLILHLGASSTTMMNHGGEVVDGKPCVVVFM